MIPCFFQLLPVFLALLSRSLRSSSRRVHLNASDVAIFLDLVAMFPMEGALARSDGLCVLDLSGGGNRDRGEK
jgi:hypothetical protein